MTLRRPMPQEQRDKIAAAIKGRKNPTASAKLKGRKKPPDFGDKIRAFWTGRKRTDENKAKISAVKKGSQATATTKAAQSAGAVRHLQTETSDTCSCFVHGYRRKHIISTAQQQLYEFLVTQFDTVILEASFGSYSVDIYLPSPYHLAIEVDGPDHRSKKMRQRDRDKDLYLLNEHQLPTVRITNEEAIIISTKQLA